MVRLSKLLFQIKTSWNITALIIFIMSGLFLLTIDCADFKSKDLKREFNICRIFGALYIVGSIIIFVLCEYFL